MPNGHPVFGPATITGKSSPSFWRHAFGSTEQVAKASFGSDDPLMRGGAIGKLCDRGPVEDGSFSGPNVLPDCGKNSGGRSQGFSGRCIRPVNRRQDFAQRDRHRRASQSIAARGPPGTHDEPRALQLQENLDKVTLGDLVRFRDLPNSNRGLFRAHSSQGEHREASVFRLRGDFHKIRVRPAEMGASPSTGSKLTAVERVEAALGLGLTRPTAGPLVVTRPDGPRARPATDRGISLVV